MDAASRVRDGVLILTISAALLLYYGLHPIYLDDTYITFRYADVFVDHGRITWHPDLPAVDGYTSLLHVLLLAALHVAGMPLVAAGSLINTACLLALVTLTFNLAESQCKGSGWIAALLLGVGHTAYGWYSAGIDGYLFATMFLWSCVLVERALRGGDLGGWAVVATSLLAMARPEGMIVGAGFWGLLLLKALVTKSPPPSRTTIGAALFFALVGAQIAWRIATYGHPLPNTFYAKVSTNHLAEAAEGARYVLEWLKAEGFLILATPVALALGAPVAVRLLFIGGLVALVIVAGGDVHFGFRFLLPLMPLAAVDAAYLLRRTWATSGVRRALIQMFVIAYAVAQLVIILGRWPLQEAVPEYVDRLASGSWPMQDVLDSLPSAHRSEAVKSFAGQITPGTHVGGTDVGMLAFASGLPIVDALGLNSTRLAEKSRQEAQGTLTFGMPQIQTIMREQIPVYYGWHPRYDDWTWTGVGGGAQPCTGTARGRALALGQAFEEMEQSYLCASHSVKGRGALNFLINRSAVDWALSDPTQVELSSCVREVAQACAVGPWDQRR